MSESETPIETTEVIERRASQSRKKKTKPAAKKAAKKVAKKKSTKQPAKQKRSKKSGSRSYEFKLLSGDSLTTGSTRARLFRALKKFPKGLTVASIKDKCKMFENSGHLAWTLRQEIKLGRVRREEHDIKGKDTLLHFLTAKGLQALKDEKIDKRGSNMTGKHRTKSKAKRKKAG